MDLTLVWTEGLKFETETANGRKLTLDGDSKESFSPTEALLSALGGCMAIDVVLILRKMREDLQGLRVRLEGERRSESPRYFQSAALRFSLRGGVDPGKAQRAIDLSRDKYCSVLHTLRPDLNLTTSFEIES